MSFITFNTSIHNNNNNHIEKCSIHVKNMEYAVGFLRGYISPIIVLFGVFGNISAFYLFLTHKPWNRFSIYVMTLAISDSLVLITNTLLDDFLGRGLYYLTNKNIIIKLDTISLISCQLMELIGTWFVFNSGCLLVAFSIDRVNCLYWPLKCRSNGGVGMAIFICSLIIIIGLIFSIPYAMLQTLIDKNVHITNSTLTNFINITNTTHMDNSSIMSNHTIQNQIYDLSHCSDCIENHNVVETMKSSSPSLTCALSTNGHPMNDKDLLSFLFSTVLTYMVPCILLVFINLILLIKLISIKSKRRILCKTMNKNIQVINWYNTTTNTNTTNNNDQINLSSNELISMNPVTPPPPPPPATTTTRTSSSVVIATNEQENSLTSTITTILQRRRHTITEDRKEIGRIVALLLLSFFYLCFTFPVSISLTIRANLNYKHSNCLHLLYAHLSRLLTSIKDINYALNGYTYAVFFQFYRTKLLKILTCKCTTTSNHTTHTYTNTTINKNIHKHPYRYRQSKTENSKYTDE
ncbi:unnamed protein product [Schistosoma margrebowiei]|uniref:G-protein coupled receptors family 1 profile domain-containing protein n=1 Tax=Schistosoma margrebowiei TaxID=48269 RepID=A0AA85A7I3_9TREM|nr:unnamed protein product [Schistosoma margrebowiei]